jgi:uncharacterized repeat protein (TIGR03803 family)
MTKYFAMHQIGGWFMIGVAFLTPMRTSTEATRKIQLIAKKALCIIFVFTFLLCLGRLLASAQTETVIHNFDITDGSLPVSGFIYDRVTGAFYSTTADGGSNNSGTVFQLAPDDTGGWTESLLYNFSGTDGSEPDYGLLSTHKNGSISALYGTTYFGGQYNNGTVFQLTLSQGSGTWNESVLYSFSSGADGGAPDDGLVMDKTGALFGTTVVGGTSNEGTLFKLEPSDSGWKETVLWNFANDTGGQPQGHLIFDQSGALYGTTTIGGRNSECGTVFQLKPPVSGLRRWTHSVLHTFVGCGYGPAAGLIFDSSGTLYGTTSSGGKSGFGTVFALKPPASEKTRWTYSLLYDFGDGDNGDSPEANLIFDRKGCLYGTTSGGGPLSGGTVFKLSPTKTPPWKATLLWAFGGANDGKEPFGPVMFHAGDLYGTTAYGGIYGWGSVFQLKP